MLIGQKVVVLIEFEFNGVIFKPGHLFTITGDDNIRGLDLEDDNGNKVGETRFIRHHYEFLSRIRDEKLKELGI
jgi:hypothetical protein